MMRWKLVLEVYSSSDIPNLIVPENGIVNERRHEDNKIHLTDELDIQLMDR